MAFIKFRELGKRFNFYKELPIKEAPEYILQYVEPGEEIRAIYCTSRDKGVFTNKKIILFDKRGIFGTTKKIDIFPYHKISSTAIIFYPVKVSLFFTFDSGYQMTLDFIKQNGDNKKRIRELYTKLNEDMDKCK